MFSSVLEVRLQEKAHWFTAEKSTGSLQKSPLVHCRKAHWFTAEKPTGSLQKSPLVHCRKAHWFTAEKPTGSLQKSPLVHCRKAHWFTVDWTDQHLVELCTPESISPSGFILYSRHLRKHATKFYSVFQAPEKVCHKISFCFQAPEKTFSCNHISNTDDNHVLILSLYLF